MWREKCVKSDYTSELHAHYLAASIIERALIEARRKFIKGENGGLTKTNLIFFISLYILQAQNSGILSHSQHRLSVFFLNVHQVLGDDSIIWNGEGKLIALNNAPNLSSFSNAYSLGG